ncbi:hypothetical protein MUK70_01105 [Dyadobacter chenwenxiniae]|uniref:Uncharacterized protein n=1 Tax=Dyadobacter chenwenxiniae TaxID=2906456 RepID=A0A9X1PKB8_9BACT|nr:hypothetical protein [Dyadobacter chenwenxiniae]MCF0062655.1 hypothetical protein [Dyadobacter chenwenxiniae]UON83602.1 hypothetical protein MUK70_01105 [Dyadobacter chenwenxiniae]
MNTKTISIALSLLLSAGTLLAQSTATQKKDKEPTQKVTAGDQSQSSKGGSITSEATTGNPPTHIDKTNSVPAASNPQNTGVNASSRKKSGSTVQGGRDAGGKNPKKAGQQPGKQ